MRYLFLGFFALGCDTLDQVTRSSGSIPKSSETIDTVRIERACYDDSSNAPRSAWVLKCIEAAAPKSEKANPSERIVQQCSTESVDLFCPLAWIFRKQGGLDYPCEVVIDEDGKTKCKEAGWKAK